MAAPAAAQDRMTVLDIELPVLDLTYETASLDDSVKTEESTSRVRVTLAADVLFRFNRASLSPRARSRIEEVAGQVEKAKPGRITVDGYTDAKGSPGYNRRLSRRRALAAAAALRAALGGRAPAIGTKGHGEADPVAPNTKKDGSDNPRGRARNRRVTITFPRAA
jgi:outer membrane protein OmpA-like peptidoglycan-associated protein